MIVSWLLAAFAAFGERLPSRLYITVDDSPALTVNALSQTRAGVYPDPVMSTEPPRTVISRVHASGVLVPLSALGEAHVSRIEILPTINQIQIDYRVLGRASGPPVRYQSRLDGVDTAWSAPTTQRVATYAHLPPGRYRLLVRAVTVADDRPGPPASVSFVVLPSIWQTWWLCPLVIVIGVMMLLTLHRFRVTRLLETERLRARIAMDLHDEIGSGLSQIAILSEVARQPGRDVEGGERHLHQIAVRSRELIDAMSDIVWLVHPARDSLGDLTRRMRTFATEVLTTQELDLRFNLPDPQIRVMLDPETRRAVFLILKEAVHNIVKHAGCTHVSITLRLERHHLVLEVSDNGVGMGEGSATGFGLAGMRARAAAVDGVITWQSSPGRGTSVTLRVRLRRLRLWPRIPRAFGDDRRGRTSSRSAEETAAAVHAMVREES